MGVQAETGSPREELIESCVSALLFAGLYKTSFTERGGKRASRRGAHGILRPHSTGGSWLDNRHGS